MLPISCLVNLRPGIGLLRARFSTSTLQSPSPAAVVLSATVLSDPRCPWCLVAHSRLHAAVQAAAAVTGRAVTLEVAWQPYFLDETLPLSPPVNRRTYYESKFGVEGMAASTAAMAKVFDSEGISARFGTQGYSIDGPASSSLPALRLLALAHTLPPASSGGSAAAEAAAGGAVGAVVGPGEALAAALFECYFGKQREDLASTEVLVRLATHAKVPWPEHRVRAFLTGSALTAEVVASAAAAKRAGLSVPHLLLQRRRGSSKAHEVTGAATVGHLTELLLDLVEGASDDDDSQNKSFRPVTESMATASTEDEAPVAAWPEVTAADAAASVAWRWRCSDLLPAMLAAAGGSWPLDNPLQDPVSDCTNTHTHLPTRCSAIHKYF
jgi:predicted DsbA family dithiol-disulfide isomerase